MNHFFSDIKKYRNHILYSVKSRLKAEVAGSKLGWIWWILEPLCFMFIYSFIYGKVLNSSMEHRNIYIFCGHNMFGFYTKTVKRSINLIQNNKGVIGRIYEPKFLLVLQAELVNGFKLLICLGICLAMVMFSGIGITWALLEIIPVLMILFLFTFGVGCFLMHCGVYLKDTANIIDIVNRILLYFTGIFYDLMVRMPYPLNYIATHWNPMAVLITASRNILIYHKPLDIRMLFFWGVLSIVIAAAGIQLVYNNENSYVKVV